MSANHRASALMIALASTFALFVAFAIIIRMPVLAKHSYDLGYGWHTQTATQPAGQCDRPLTTKGFPVTTSRPAAADPSGCSDETNPLAGDMNLSLCFAAAAIISVGIAGTVNKIRV